MLASVFILARLSTGILFHPPASAGDWVRLFAEPVERDVLRLHDRLLPA